MSVDFSCIEFPGPPSPMITPQPATSAVRKTIPASERRILENIGQTRLDPVVAAVQADQIVTRRLGRIRSRDQEVPTQGSQPVALKAIAQLSRENHAKMAEVVEHAGIKRDHARNRVALGHADCRLKRIA